MKRILSILTVLALFMTLLAVTPAGAELYGLATQKLATRTGPGTQYEEGGTYFVEGEYIQVISRAYDEANGIWWVKCAIPYHGEIRILWTGYKRFDSNQLPLETIPIEGEETTVSYAGGDWENAYRQFILVGEYENYLSNPDTEYNNLLLDRDDQWDTFFLYDFDDNGIPELVVETTYGIEQADVFTWDGSRVLWTGMMGGDNFFQGVFEYPEYPQAGLIAVMGGPAMTIDSYTLSGTRLNKVRIGQTTVDSEGMETTGINMYVDNSYLYGLLYETLVNYGGSEFWLYGGARLFEIEEGDWSMLFR